MVSADEGQSRLGKLMRSLRSEFSFPKALFEIAVFAITAGGPPWWLSYVLNESIPWYCYVVWGISVLLGAVVYILSKLLKSMKRSGEEMDERLSKANVDMMERDSHVKVLEGESACQGRRIEALCNLQGYCRELVQAPDSVVLAGQEQDSFYYLCSNLCDGIAQVFRDGSIGSEKVSAALRLSKAGSFAEYVTVGRSSGLNPSRRKHSQPVTERSYVYQELVTDEEGSDRVIRIGDIEKAIEKKQFSRDYNTKHFHDELTSLLISRVNVATKEGGVDQDALWGILYIGSPDRDYFKERDEMLARVISNLVATTLWKALDKRQKTIEECQR